MRRLGTVGLALLALAVPSGASADPLADTVAGNWVAHLPAFDGWQQFEVKTRRLTDAAGEYHGGVRTEVFADDGTRMSNSYTPGLIVLNAWLPRSYRYAALLHEYAHARDDSVMTDADRDDVRTAMRTSRPWKGGRNPLFEKYAEAYAYCGLSGSQRYRLGYGWVHDRLTGTVYDYHPTQPRLRATCAVIRGQR